MQQTPLKKKTHTLGSWWHCDSPQLGYLGVKFRRPLPPCKATRKPPVCSGTRHPLPSQRAAARQAFTTSSPAAAGTLFVSRLCNLSTPPTPPTPTQPQSATHAPDLLFHFPKCPWDLRQICSLKTGHPSIVCLCACAIVAVGGC